MVSLAPFISRDDLGDLLGEDLTSSDAALIAVDAACDICRTEAEQTFNEVAAETVILDGTGTDALLLPERPVTEVSAVEVFGEAVENWTLNGQGILLRTRAATVEDWGDWPWFARLLWPAGRQNVSVTYDHGYADGVFPRDVRVVALNIAVRLFRSSASSSGIASETLGAYSVSYVTTSSATTAGDLVTTGEKAILRKYKQAKSF